MCYRGVSEITQEFNKKNLFSTGQQTTSVREKLKKNKAGSIFARLPVIGCSLGTTSQLVYKSSPQPWPIRQDWNSHIKWSYLSFQNGTLLTVRSHDTFESTSIKSSFDVMLSDYKNHSCGIFFGTSDVILHPQNQEQKKCSCCPQWVIMVTMLTIHLSVTPWQIHKADWKVSNEAVAVWKL